MAIEGQAAPDEGLDTRNEVIVSLTPKAVEQVRAAMAREGVAGHGLRVGVVGGGCSGMSYNLEFAAQPAADDRVIEIGGVRIFIDASSQPHLEGVTIDYVTGLHGAGFKFLNPNASRTCGCGSSFSTHE